MAARLLAWIQELNPTLGNHSIFLLVDRSVAEPDADLIKRLAEAVFGHVTRAWCQTSTEYPSAATEMFGFAARHMNGAFKLPWLWLEPDCVPLVPGWLQALADAYEASPKRYLGPFVRSNKPEFPPVHLNGVSVYPNNAIVDYKPFLSGEIESEFKSWDMATHKIIPPRAAETVLIQQFFGKQNMPPVFIERPKTESDPENFTTTALIDERAVLFHRCKDGSLIEILRKRRAAIPPKLPEPAANEPKENMPPQPIAFEDPGPRIKVPPPRKPPGIPAALTIE